MPALKLQAGLSERREQGPEKCLSAEFPGAAPATTIVTAQAAPVERHGGSNEAIVASGANSADAERRTSIEDFQPRATALRGGFPLVAVRQRFASCP